MKEFPYLEGLNDAQREAAAAPDEPLLIVAGAGTGKTRTLTSRVAHLIHSGILPERICVLTFTNKAAREMRERVAAMPDVGSRLGRGKTLDMFGRPDPFLGTFHSFGARLLRNEHRLLGRTKNFAIYDDDDTLSLIKKIMKSMERVPKETSPHLIANIISLIKNGVREKEGLSPSHPVEGVALRALEKYEETLAEMNAFDFDDLIEKSAALLTAHPERREAYQKRFTHFLVDEYQDVNNRQYELIRLLAAPRGSLSVVGDDQQTIYSWRGSNFGIFLDFEKDWQNARTTFLEENYRSAATIINAAGAVIAKNKRQKKKTLWTKNPEGGPVGIFEAMDEDDEAEWVSSEIERLKIQDQNEGVAVLYRTNAQSRAIEQALIARRIGYRVYGGLKFYDRKEIRDILAALRLIVNPLDGVSRDRLLKALPKTALRPYEAAMGGNGGMPAPTEAIRQFLTATNYMDFVDRRLTNADDRKENIAELLHFASRFEDLPEFLEHVALVQSTDESLAQSKERGAGGEGEKLPTPSPKLPAVQLMTIHLAKGLEFDAVFVIGCTEGLLPHARSLESEEGVEEERRLMYVAMTRARKRLTLSFYDYPSRFLSDIPQEFTDYESTVASRGSRFEDNEERYITLD